MRNLERGDMEVISAVLGWASSGFKQIETMRPGDFEAVAEFMGCPIEIDEIPEEVVRQRLREMRRDIERVNKKVKTLYGV